jgi:hypothetical protein
MGEGRIGGDVVSYVEYAIAALYEDAEKKIRRTCYRLLGIPHNIYCVEAPISDVQQPCMYQTRALAGNN